MRTPEQIAEDCEGLDGVANIKAINKLFRAQDESDKWPICGRFNVTNRAIRRLQKIQGCIEPGLEYAYALDAEISNIVNGRI